MSAPNDIFSPVVSLEAEQHVIGAVMTDNLAYDRIASTLRDSDFAHENHRLIYRAATSLIDSGKQANVLTIYEKLDRKADGVGGLAYLNSLQANSLGPSGIVGYAKIVRERSILRGLQGIAMDAMETVQNRAGRTAEEIILGVEERVYALAEDGALDDAELPSLADVLPVVKAEIQERIESGRPQYGLRTGLVDLDEKTLGLHPGQFVVIAGRPGMGKTALAIQVAMHCGIAGGKALVFEMEMERRELVQRELANEARVSLMDIRRGTLDNEQVERLERADEKIRDARVYIDERPALSIAQIRARVRRVKRRHGLDLVVVDHIGLARGHGEKRYEQIGSISRGLKEIAKEFKVPVIGLSQLNRGVEQLTNKRPKLSDLRESGDIEQDADVVLLMYRDEYYNADTVDKGIAEVEIAKQRNGPVGRVFLRFDGEYTRFDNLAQAYTPPPMPKAKPIARFDD